MHSLDELFEHLFGDGEIGNYAVPHRTYDSNIAWRAPEHLLGCQPNLLDNLLVVRATSMANCYHRWLIQHNAFAACPDQGISSTQIYR